MENNKDLDEKTRFCWACRSSLVDGQKICLECNSWQNWRKLLNISNTTLSLAVALIATLGAAVPNLIRMGTRDFVNYELISGEVIYTREDDRKTLRLKLVNSGNVNSITPILLFCYHAVDVDENSNYPMGVKSEDFFEFHSSERQLVPPGEVTSVEYFAADTYHFEADKEISGGALLCQFRYRDTNEDQRILKLIAFSRLVLELTTEEFVFN